MSFPVCQHRKRTRATAAGTLRWLAAEPFRVFFFSGAVWSIIGVSLWPLFHAGQLAFYPSLVHARIMIEAFGGAFIIGFLGTAGPRMAGAPKLTPVELLLLFGLHSANGVCHLLVRVTAGEACFLALLVTLLVCLVARVIRFHKETPPPQMLLALAGVLCGIAGAALWLVPDLASSLPLYRFAGLLLNQGFLLLPVLGIGSFIFPRILGGEFGDPASASERRWKLIRAASAAVVVIASFVIEAWMSPLAGSVLRAAVASIYLVVEVRWRGGARGSLAAGLLWALGLGLLGLVLAGFDGARHVAAAHLLYIGGFGLLMLVVASRVLFGHSGELDGFARRSWFVRVLIALVVTAALTRASTGWFPAITISHHYYASSLWALVAALWLGWHRHRFVKREEE